MRLPALAGARLAAAVGLLDRHDVAELAHVWGGLRDASTRSAFLRTLRSVVDIRGQSVSSRDRLYLAAAIPMLLVWGARDPVLPVAHARAVARELPACRIEVLPRAGHLPHRTDPKLFAEIVTRFVRETDAASHDRASWRESLGRG